MRDLGSTSPLPARAKTTDADSRRRDTWLWAAVLVISIWQIVDVVIRYV